MRTKLIAPALLTALALWLSVPAHAQNAPPAPNTKERAIHPRDRDPKGPSGGGCLELP
jgi:hypothetical protein